MNAAQPDSVNKNFSINLRTDYILEIHVSQGVYGRREVEEIVKAIYSVSKNQEYLVLVITDKDARVTLGGVKFLASSEALKYALAKAYVIHSRHQRIMADLFSTFFKPSESIRFFNNKADAELWLTSLISPGNEI